MSVVSGTIISIVSGSLVDMARHRLLACFTGVATIDTISMGPTITIIINVFGQVGEWRIDWLYCFANSYCPWIFLPVCIDPYSGRLGNMEKYET